MTEQKKRPFDEAEKAWLRAVYHTWKPNQWHKLIGGAINQSEWLALCKKWSQENGIMKIQVPKPVIKPYTDIDKELNDLANEFGGEIID